MVVSYADGSVLVLNLLQVKDYFSQFVVTFLSFNHFMGNGTIKDL